MIGFRGRSRAVSHRFCQENLSAYIDRQLSARDRERLVQHLEQCQTCQWDLQTLERTVELLRQLPQARAPRSFRIPYSTPAPSLPFWLRPWVYNGMRVATAAVSVLLVIALAGQALSLGLAYNEQPMLRTFAYQQDGYGAEQPAAAPLAAATAAQLPPAEPTVAASSEDQRAPTARGEKATAAEAPTPEPLLGGGVVAEPTNAAAAGLSPEVIARMTAAPLGKGGAGPEPERGLEAVPLTPAAQPTQVPENLAIAEATPLPGATAAPEVQPAAKVASPPPEGTPAPAGAALAQAAPTPSPEVREAVRVAPAGGEAEANVPLAPVSPVRALRERLSLYPWNVITLAAGGGLVVLGAITLWLRAVRARWL